MSGCIFRFFADKSNNLWIATNDGVYVYNAETAALKKYDTSNSGLSNNNILFLSEDSKGRIWIGTLDGLCILDKSTDVIRSDVFSKTYASMLKEIYYVYEDQSKNNWICTFQGVLKVDESLSGQIHYTANDFLPGDIVKSVIEDSNNNLWFATYGGIVCYNPVTGESTAYSAVDGILGYDFGNVVQSRSGMFWWANEKGLLYCDISKLKPAAALSHPQITAFYISKKEIEDGDERFIAAEYLKKISLSYSENNIGFRFSLLNYSFPKSEVYEYMLEGYDTGWQKQVGKNDVYYSDLPSGKYVFRLRSLGDENSETSVEIEIGKNYSTLIWITVIVLLIVLFSVILYKKRKAVVKGFRKSLNQEKYKNSKIEQSSVEKVTERLLNYMESEKPYLNPEFKQATLAQAVDCSSTELSQIMNQHLKTGFNDLVNKYRIEEFKGRIQDKDSARYTLTAISEQCGFTSRSSFFRAFKKQTGQTPLEYLKSVNKNIEL
jgi:AraC-like DNA-binding protein